MRPGLPLVAAALDDVVEVRDDAGGDERLAVLVEVDAPGVARAVGEDLEVVPRRVIAPDAGVDRDAVGVGRAGLADARVGEDAVAAVEPAVGAPGERVERLVRVLRSPSRRAGPAGGPSGRSSPSLSGMNRKLRGRADPDAAEADLEAADEVQLVGEDLARVEPAVAVGVLEDQDAVAAPGRRGRGPGTSTPRRPRAGPGRRSRTRSAGRRRARRRRA